MLKIDHPPLGGPHQSAAGKESGNGPSLGCAEQSEAKGKKRPFHKRAHASDEYERTTLTLGNATRQGKSNKPEENGTKCQEVSSEPWL